MKKYYFLLSLFAALSFAACSDDSDTTLDEVTPGEEEVTPGEEETTDYITEATVEFNNDASITVISPENTSSRVDNDEADITVQIKLDEIMNADRSYFIDADDFAIRINNKYVEGIKPKDNVVRYDDMMVSENNLQVRVNGIDKLDFPTSDEIAAGEEEKVYTYEVYLWMDDATWGADTKAENKGDVVFTTEQRQNWQKDISTVSGAWKNPDKFENGYRIEYNVYRGAQGNALPDGTLDTGYIKVSIHVYKVDDTIKTEVKPIEGTVKEE